MQDNASALPVEEQDEEEGNGEEEEEEEQERIDYDEKYTFTQTEYWECKSPCILLLRCYLLGIHSLIVWSSRLS